MQPTANIKNRLLLALPRRELDPLLADLVHIETRYKQVLIDDESSLDQVYFPNSGVISVIGVYSDGSAAEMATIGREGTTGFQELLGARASGVRLLTQIEGSAMRIKRAAYDAAAKNLPTFRLLMYAHLHAFLHQLMISCACNATHSVKQRLARWLLMMHDRHDDDVLPLTQDLLAEMLSVHRPTATKALRQLQNARTVQVRRGGIEILDRQELTAHSCECYQIARVRTARLLPKTYPTPR